MKTKTGALNLIAEKKWDKNTDSIFPTDFPNMKSIQGEGRNNFTCWLYAMLIGLVALGYAPTQKHRQAILQVRQQLADKGLSSETFNYEAKVLCTIFNCILIFHINCSWIVTGAV